MSFTRILVPLDGSSLAPAVLPTACSLAETLGAQVLLVHVLEREPPIAVQAKPHLADTRDAAAYLQGQARRVHERGLSTEVHIHETPRRRRRSRDRPPRARAQRKSDRDVRRRPHERSHARGGWLAERVLRRASAPILFRTIRRPDATSFELGKILIPIDFGHDFEAALSATRALAQPYGATVFLLAVSEPPLPPASLLLPATTTLSCEFEREYLRRQLAELATRLRADLDDVRTIVAEAPPADAILAASDLPRRVGRWKGDERQAIG